VRAFLAVLTAWAVIIACKGVLLLEPVALYLDEDPDALLSFAIVLVPFLLLCLILVAAGVLVMPNIGLQSHLLDRIRGTARPRPGGWLGAALAGIAVGVMGALFSAAIRAAWPASFEDETAWSAYGLVEIVNETAGYVLSALIAYAGLLSLIVWIFLKSFKTAQRRYLLASAVTVNEVLGLALMLLAPLLVDEASKPGVIAETVAWTPLSILSASLYVTRSLEHGLLALLCGPVVILALRPLWSYFAI
jgi:hypothetical protein